MTPKVKCCLGTVEASVEKAHILDDRQGHAIILEMFTAGGVGTEIVVQSTFWLKSLLVLWPR